jgi:flagellar biosynthesis protein FlhF
MFLKRFRASSTAAALEAARIELGPDALLLGAASVPVHGWRRYLGSREVEITAAVERQVSETRQEAQADRHSEQLGMARLAAQLGAAGLDATIVNEITSTMKSRRRSVSWRDLQRALATWAEGIAAGDDDRARVEVFVGPSGAGKTTTIAKIAAQARVKRGKRLGLISADAFRVGAVEQLRLYADIIGSRFTAARTPDELVQAVSDSQAPLLVDTAGRSPRDVLASELAPLFASTVDVRVHLVIPAGSGAKDLGRILEIYKDVKPQRVVLTKLDENQSIGPLAGELRARGLRISHLGIGQLVPEDLTPATPQALAAALLGDVVGHAA